MIYGGRLNPFYDMHSTILKLTGPSKPMLVNEWFKSVNAFIRSINPGSSRRGMLNFYPHMDNALLARLFPLVAAPNPPVEIAQVPYPPEAPALPTNATLDEHRLWNLVSDRSTTFQAGLLTIWQHVIASVDDSIYSHLLTLSDDIMDVTLVQIMDYILGAAFATKSEDNIEHYLSIVNAPFDHSISLLQNFERMEQASSMLRKEATSRAKSDNDLYAIAKKKCEKNPRLDKSIEAFLRLPGMTELTATFVLFKEFIVSDYPKTIQHDTGHLAYFEDKDHAATKHAPATNPAPKRYHPLGAAADADPEPDGALALAAKAGGKYVSETEYAAFQAFQKAGTAHPKPPKLPVIGKLCFFHGWNPSHNSINCKLMAGDPKFTPAQRAFTAVPAGHNLLIDGIKCCIKCSKGVVPAP